MSSDPASSTPFDLAVIGGGINGCGCAADAALRGLKIVLIEQGDLAAGTSSKSTKLIHGGLRYLEQLHFGLVRKALKEREHLQKLAPHLVHPQAFVLLNQNKKRPLWLIRLGLFLYDHLSSSNSLPKSRCIDAKKEKNYFSSLKPRILKGCLFYDAKTCDARLTLTNALMAKEHGASIRTHTKLINATFENGLWQLTLREKTGIPYLISAKAIINCSGPWVNEVSQLLHIPPAYDVSLIKGSHIIVHSFYVGTQAYLLQHDDSRVIFVIPFHGYTMIGTTEVPFEGALDNIHIDKEEVTYLCHAVNQYFQQTISEADIIATWSGVRTLVSHPKKSAHALSRDYTYLLTKSPGPVVTVYGGKLTTYRQLAAEVVEKLKPFFPNLPNSKTLTTPLPGATHHALDFKAYLAYAKDKYYWLPQETLEHYLNHYGTRLEIILNHRHDLQDLGICFAPNFYEAEVEYLVKHEWAENCDDILWRRTKFGLSIGAEAKQQLMKYLQTITP